MNVTPGLRVGVLLVALAVLAASAQTSLPTYAIRQVPGADVRPLEDGFWTTRSEINCGIMTAGADRSVYC